MKRIILLIITTLFAINSFSQEKYDSRLLTVFKKETLDKYTNTQPGLIRWENFKVSHMYKYITLADIDNPGKLDTLKRLDRKTKTVLNEKITLPDEKEFNPYLYNIEWKAKEDTYYLVPGTNTVIKIFSRHHVITEYNRTLQ